jgi:glutaconyl-CoA/methylmalonyl-CoA decarboxylase subunit gamma
MKKYLITVNQNQYEVEVVELRQSVSRPTQPLASSGAAKLPVGGSSHNELPIGASGKKITAPMPGNVIKLLVSPGDHVKVGQKLLVFEAMKMENELNAPSDGVISEVKVAEGSVISFDELLMVIN